MVRQTKSIVSDSVSKYLFLVGSDIDDVPNMQTLRQSYRNVSMIIGDKPGQIDNTDIEGENKGQLKENIQFNRDYILLPQKAWDLLHEWYLGAPTFSRKVIIGKDSKPIIELHPPLISSILCDNEGNLSNQSTKSMFVSSSNKLSEVFLKICEMYNYVSTDSARLWK